jgi:taurine dioxygenase
MDLEIVPTGGPLGAEVRGVDLSREQRGEVVHALLRAFADHQVLLFREQKLTNQRLLEVSEWFGPRYVPPPDLPVLGDETQPPVVPVSNVAEGGVLGHASLAAHSDLQYMPVPLLGAMLHAVEVPDEGGDTSWSNLYRAWDELDAGTRERARSLRCWFYNPYAGPRALRGLAGPNQKYVESEVPRFPHPVARTHPVTGRTSLYMSWLAGGLADVDGEEGRALLDRLRRHADQPHLYWTHRWHPGDVVLWDNRCTNHKRTAFDPAARRVMYRVQIAGSRPF